MSESSLIEFRRKVDQTTPESTAAGGGESDKLQLDFEALDSPNTMMVVVFPNSSRGHRDLRRHSKNAVLWRSSADVLPSGILLQKFTDL